MTNTPYSLHKGNIPILVSMPHNGVEIPESIANTMTEDALKLVDTDWFLDRLYDFVIEQGAWIINPRYSRYVIDLNRPKDNISLYPGQDTTELCPTTTFAKQPIYLKDGTPNQSDIEDRISKYWQPYHSEIQASIQTMKEQHGIALLFEAHSIKSEVPRFFDGKLTDFNFGDYNGGSCNNKLSQRLKDWLPKGYSKVINGRFKGGYLTREYGQPNDEIHSIQLELSQSTYMDEARLSYDIVKAEQVIKELHSMFDCFKAFVADFSFTEKPISK